MIGVVPRAHQAAVVQEFFELFKTPWELYVPGHFYDVVIAPSDNVPACETRLLIVHGAVRSEVDIDHSLADLRLERGGSFERSGTTVPVYGDLITFGEMPDASACVRGASGVLGLSLRTREASLIRLGYDLFDEVKRLIGEGQPAEHAGVPTLDIHIQMLRDWISAAGVTLVEIPPVPDGRSFIVCLTHDIDFVGIRRHWCDHTMWGFLYRATVGTLLNAWRRRLSIRCLAESWRAVACLPFVYLGWAKDFWYPFDWYLAIDGSRPATYFLIPFKQREGAGLPGRGRSRRATAYDITDIQPAAATLLKAGCEIGVHGIDAWRDPVSGRVELDRIASVTHEPPAGIRMHWLFRDSSTPVTLERAGYAYDSTGGYNETVGYRHGTTQVFRPAGARTLLELPLHIQDGALFFPNQLGLTEPAASERCGDLIQHAQSSGGVLTVLWHDRSHAPERFWGGFYISLVHALDSHRVWFATAGQAVEWFRNRRSVRFDAGSGAAEGRVRLTYEGGKIDPPLRVVIHRPGGAGTPAAFSWDGTAPLEVERLTPAETVVART